MLLSDAQVSHLAGKNSNTDSRFEITLSGDRFCLSNVAASSFKTLETANRRKCAALRLQPTNNTQIDRFRRSIQFPLDPSQTTAATAVASKWVEPQDCQTS